MRGLLVSIGTIMEGIKLHRIVCRSFLPGALIAGNTMPLLNVASNDEELFPAAIGTTIVQDPFFGPYPLGQGPKAQ